VRRRTIQTRRYSPRHLTGARRWIVLAATLSFATTVSAPEAPDAVYLAVCPDGASFAKGAYPVIQGYLKLAPGASLAVQAVDLTSGK
jgi:hypothetical protein